MLKEKKNSTPYEAVEQEAVFRWSRANAYYHPQLQMLNASLSGIRIRPGQAVMAKKQGMVKGYPDIYLPVARKGAHGLFIELKRLKGGSVSPEQKQWHKWLLGEGYEVHVCRGHEEAISAICDYLDIRKRRVSDEKDRNYGQPWYGKNKSGI